MKYKSFFTHGMVLLLALMTIQAQYKLNAQDNTWQQPDQEIMDILHAPGLPYSWISPTGEYMLIGDPVSYPPLAEYAGPMYKLAGMRVNPANNSFMGNHGGTSPRLVRVEGGKTIALDLPKDAEVMNVRWTANGGRFALSVSYPDRIELWVGAVDGNIKKMEGFTLNPLLDSEMSWLPDQKHLLVRNIPDRGPVPPAPAIPAGPKIVEGTGASARSTYEARNLLETVHDDLLFDYYTSSELIILNPETGSAKKLGKPAPYTNASFSPDGEYVLVEYLVAPWSHEVAYWRFAHEIEVWTKEGEKVTTIASIPLSDAVPVHGVPLGARGVQWRPTAPHTLFWVEALDGGDPVAEVDHRDRMLKLEAPFTGEATEVFRATHRIQGRSWGQDGMLMLTERERMKRWRYVWLLDVDSGTSRLWYDLDESDRYGDPGSPLYTTMPNGFYVLKQDKNSVYFRGSGAAETGDRPFLDMRDLKTGKTTRLFRADPEKYEYFVGFAAKKNTFILRSESPTEVPNYYLGEFGRSIKPKEGEAAREYARTAITRFKDPAPQLRQITKQIVRYEREDGVQLSFQLLLPPGYQEGEKLPTVIYAYPMEYSGAGTAGQVRGSAKRFMRIYGPSHLYFLLKGYAVLDQTAMPMIGDPETTYDTFVPQLVADAEAAVNKAVEMGVTDPDRIGVIGHSHGGLMVANLLAHTDLFSAGIARSGSYNKTTQPFGFQSERRSLFEARDVYINLSPTFFADKVNEPVLIIHGNDDSNPGTLTFQSEVFFEAVRGSGGTARMVLLPYEDHGYRAKESIEHVLWEQLRWFDMYVKGSDTP